MAKRTFKVFHKDHGITDPQFAHIQHVLEAAAPEGFFIKEVKIPEDLGTVPSGIYGPCMGDAPVPEEDVYYAKRGADDDKYRFMDRMVKRPTRPVDYVQCIGVRDEKAGEIRLFTCYGGPLAPQHPDDPSNQDVEGARKFWSKHALCG